MSIIIKSGNSQALAGVTDDGQLKTATAFIDTSGVQAKFRPDGFVQVAQTPTGLFLDSFETFNTTDLWTTTGTAPTVSAGNLVVAAGTTANARSLAVSIPTFSLSSEMYLQATFVVQTETTPVAGPITGNKRIWGLGVPAATPTMALPLSNGVVFETGDTDGQLYGAVYSSGVRTQMVALPRPTDGTFHRYTILHRTSRVYFLIDEVAQGSAAFPNPANATVALVAGSLNGASAVSTAPQMLLSQASLGDTGRNAVQIADASFPFRKVEVGRNGGLSVKGSTFTATSATFAVNATGTVGPVDVSEAGNVTFIIKNTVAATAFTGNPIVMLEQSDDAVSWAPLYGSRSDTNVSGYIHVLDSGIGANTSVMVDCGAEGISYVRARVIVGPSTAGMTVVVQPGGMPFSPTVTLAQPVRTAVNLFAISTGPTSTVEQLFTLTRASGTSANSTAASQTLIVGRRYRIGSIVCSQIGNTTTATRADTTFRLRVNFGAVTVSSTPILWAARVGTTATLGAYDSIQQTFAEGLELAGDGFMQFAFTYQSNYTTNPPTLNISVQGYEY